MEELITWLRGWYEAEEGVARRALAEGYRRVDPPATAGDAYNAAWAPDRILADLALKQRILGLHGQSQPRGGGSCASCLSEAWPCLTIRLLALPYADRQGYRQDWRP